MKEERQIQDKINLLEKELITITEKIEDVSNALKDIEELKLELKGLKIFLARLNPDFKSQFPEIMKKIT